MLTEGSHISINRETPKTVELAIPRDVVSCGRASIETAAVVFVVGAWATHANVTTCR